MNKLLKTEEVAQTLGLKKNTMEIWRSKGQGPAFVRVGRAVRYREEDIEAYLAAGSAQNTCRTVAA